jgi:nitrile hydratase
MNGAQDLGGMMGFGPVEPEPNEPIFHAPWEKRALGLTLACGALGEWNIDISRHARETLHPADYLSSSYYEIWIKGLLKLLAARGLVDAAELAAGRSLNAPRATARPPLRADQVPAVLARGGPCDRPLDRPARFKLGDRVRTRNMNPVGHTRLPRYARDRIGVVEAVLRLPRQQCPRQGRESAMGLFRRLHRTRALGRGRRPFAERRDRLLGALP